MTIPGEGELSAPPVGGPGILGQIGHLAGHLSSQIGRCFMDGNAGQFNNIEDDSCQKVKVRKVALFRLNPLAGRKGDWWEGAGVCTERQVVKEEAR